MLLQRINNSSFLLFQNIKVYHEEQTYVINYHPLVNWVDQIENIAIVDRVMRLEEDTFQGERKGYEGTGDQTRYNGSSSIDGFSWNGIFGHILGPLMPVLTVIIAIIVICIIIQCCPVITQCVGNCANIFKRSPERGYKVVNHQEDIEMQVLNQEPVNRAATINNEDNMSINSDSALRVEQSVPREDDMETNVGQRSRKREAVDLRTVRFRI